ncbi:MAG: hypothetical protein ACI93N_001640, partial [Flavobacteriaceae bacterium]
KKMNEKEINMTFNQAKKIDLMLKEFINPKFEKQKVVKSHIVRKRNAILKVIPKEEFENLLVIIRKEQIKLGFIFINSEGIFIIQKKLIHLFLQDSGFTKIIKKQRIEFCLRVVLLFGGILAIIRLIFLGHEYLNQPKTKQVLQIVKMQSKMIQIKPIKDQKTFTNQTIEKL